MKSVDAFDSICRFVSDAWNETQFGPMLWPARADTPPDSGPWARLTIAHIDGGQRSLVSENRAALYEGVGIITVQCFCPINAHIAGAYNAAQAIVDAFSGLRGREIVFRHPRIKEASANGGFHQVNAIVNFEYSDVR